MLKISKQYGSVPTLTLGKIDSINEYEKEDFQSYVDDFLKYIVVNEQYDGKYRKTTLGVF